MILKDIGQLNESKGPVIVKAEAPWCGPCRAIAPTVESVCKKCGVPLYSLDVDVAPELAQSLDIAGLPTIVAFYDGVPIMGLRPNEVSPTAVEEFVERIAD